MSDTRPTSCVGEFRDDFGDLIVLRSVAGSDYTQVAFYSETYDTKMEEIEAEERKPNAYMTFGHQDLIEFASMLLRRGIEMMKHYESMSIGEVG